MHYIYSLLHLYAFIHCFSFFGHKNFTVIIKEGAVYETDNFREIELFSVLNRKKCLHLDSGSLLVLMDRYNNYFEYRGPLDLSLEDVPIRNTSLRGSELNFEDLYNNGYVLRSTSSTLPVHIYEPFNAENGIYKNDSLRIKWVDNSDSQMYRVLIYTLDLDTLVNKSTILPEFFLDNVPDELCIIRIVDQFGKDLSMEYGLSNIRNTSLGSPTSSVDFLMSGLFLESIGHFDLAHQYFIEASKNNDYKTIRDLIRLHEIRYSRLRGNVIDE